MVTVAKLTVDLDVIWEERMISVKIVVDLAVIFQRSNIWYSKGIDLVSGRARMDKIILFDGICNLCNRSVRFIMRHDRSATFKFASLQSEVGQKLLNQHPHLAHENSVILIADNRVFSQSTAALKIARQLDGGWKLLYAFILIPAPIRDFIYNIIARNRYRWFGKRDVCSLPTQDQSRRME
jgi:predicted DCC family thiol-disulfide oxidoreductase YuxK